MRTLDIGTRRIRDNLERRARPRMQAAIHRALQEQQRRLLRRLDEHWDLISRVGAERTEGLWWDAAMDALLTAAVVPEAVGVAQATSAHIGEAFGAPD